MTDNEPLGPPPIEPLSDAAWARVERGLWWHMDAPPTRQPVPSAPRRRWIVVAPLAAAIAATVVIVISVRDGAEDVAITSEPSRVVSGSAPAAVSFGDIHIELDAATALVTSREAGHPVMVLEHGAAWFTVAPRQQRPDVVVRAGDATIRVVGTRFRVARAGEHSEVEVEHGLVEVQFHGGVTGIAANQRWSSESPWHVSTIAAAQPPAPAPAHEVPAPLEPAPAPDPRPAATPTPRPAHATPRPPQAADAAERDRAEYDRLAALEPSSPEAALAGYLALARGTGPWAAPALYAAARLAVDEHDHRAKTLLDSYLRRFPRGANAADAMQLRERLH